MSTFRRRALKYRSEIFCSTTELPRSTFVGSDPEIRQGSGIGPTVKRFYNPYDWYCSFQAQTGDTLTIGDGHCRSFIEQKSYRKRRIPKSENRDVAR